MACELACSFTKEECFAPALSRMTVMQVYELGVNVPIACVNCREAPCIPSCPSEAIVRDEELGAVRILAELCSACGECVEACPYGAVHIPAGGELALMCDLCRGQPACVPACLYGALRYDGQPDAAYAYLELATEGLDLPEKRWKVAGAVAARVGEAREVAA
jgi:Fe-S-cluster-containing hydrogenase component 2